MKDLVLIGAGGFGREVAWMVDNINAQNEEWNLLGFIDNNLELKGKILNGIPVLGGTDWLKSHNEEIYVASTIANPKLREKMIKEVSIIQHISFATLIDPTVLRSQFVEIGVGSILCAGTIITTNIKIGNHVIINLDCTVGHDTVISDYCTFYPSVNVSGSTIFESYVEVGTGCQIIQGKTIGESTIIGAGSVVVKDMPSNCTAVGIPAIPIKYHENN